MLQLVCVFDADMLPKPEFFVRMLLELNDPQVALVLSPQSFHNFDPKADIFNHSNLSFWQYVSTAMPWWCPQDSNYKLLIMTPCACCNPTQTRYQQVMEELCITSRGA